jgi:hypothetical protein
LTEGETDDDRDRDRERDRDGDGDRDGLGWDEASSPRSGAALIEMIHMRRRAESFLSIVAIASGEEDEGTVWGERRVRAL